MEKLKTKSEGTYKYWWWNLSNVAKSFKVTSTQVYLLFFKVRLQLGENRPAYETDPIKNHRLHNFPSLSAFS